MKARHLTFLMIVLCTFCATEVRNIQITAGDCIYWKLNFTECHGQDDTCKRDNCRAIVSPGGFRYENIDYHEKDGGTRPEPTTSVRVPCKTEVICTKRDVVPLSTCNEVNGDCFFNGSMFGCIPGYDTEVGPTDKKDDWLDPGLCDEE